MKDEYEQKLERAIDRELKALPPLPAPAELAARVFQAIARAATLPWYRRAWQTWPAAWRIVSFAVLVAVFGGLCFVAWQSPHSTLGLVVSAKIQACLSTLNSLQNAALAVRSSAVLILKQVHTTVLVLCLASVAFGYFLCVGLGSVCLRLAWARR